MSNKYCAGCKWLAPLEDFYPNRKCGHESNLSAASGRPEFSCEYQREAGFVGAIINGTCGRSGRFFEPKEESND